jgi:hypothetical protein
MISSDQRLLLRELKGIFKGHSVAIHDIVETTGKGYPISRWDIYLQNVGRITVISVDGYETDISSRDYFFKTGYSAFATMHRIKNRIDSLS